MDEMSYTISPSVNSRPPDGMCVLYHMPAPCGKPSYFRLPMASENAAYTNIAEDWGFTPLLIKLILKTALLDYCHIIPDFRFEIFIPPIRDFKYSF